MSTNNVYLRAMESWTDMYAVEALQGDIWGYGQPGAGYPYPARALFEFAESGGLIGGAYLEGQLIGLSVAWLGKVKSAKTDYLHSQIVGVLEEHRSLGVGALLKTQQMEFAKQNTIELIRWTFDPIKTRNANLNIRKLRGIVRTYLPNYYETLAGTQNKGLPTDRFLVEWYVGSDRVNNSSKEIPISEIRPINKVEVDSIGNKILTSFDLNLKETDLLFEVPLNLERIVGLPYGFPVAERWQSGVRETFSHYFSQDYIIEDFFIIGEKRNKQAFYKLVNSDLSKIIGG